MFSIPVCYSDLKHHFLQRCNDINETVTIWDRRGENKLFTTEFRLKNST